MVEYVLSEDVMYYGYDELGNTRGTPRFNALKPIKLKWNLPQAVFIQLVFVVYSSDSKENYILISLVHSNHRR